AAGRRGAAGVALAAERPRRVARPPRPRRRGARRARAGRGALRQRARARAAAAQGHRPHQPGVTWTGAVLTATAGILARLGRDARPARWPGCCPGLRAARRAGGHRRRHDRDHGARGPARRGHQPGPQRRARGRYQHYRQRFLLLSHSLANWPGISVRTTRTLLAVIRLTGHPAGVSTKMRDTLGPSRGPKYPASWRHGRLLLLSW